MKPTISKGLGALTPETWSEIYASVQANKQQDFTGDHERGKRFIAVIDSSSIVTAGTAIWKYAWTEKRRASNTTNSVTTVDSARSGTTSTGYAVNLLELANTAGTAYGFAVSSLTLTNADGYQIKPIPNGTPVEMIMRRANDGSLSYEFIAPNPIDGICPAGVVQFLDGGSYGES
jgi:hypothetical protein